MKIFLTEFQQKVTQTKRIEVILKESKILSFDDLKLAEAGINKIAVKDEIVYKLRKFERTNQDTCRNERPVVKKETLLRR